MRQALTNARWRPRRPLCAAVAAVAGARTACSDGLLAGVAAGIVLLFGQMLGAIAADQSAAGPLQLAATLVHGPAPLAELLPRPGTLLAGVAAHLLLSAAAGLAWAWSVAHLLPMLRRSLLAHALAATGYGFGLWVLHVQLFARIAWPWFLETNTVLQIYVHTLLFGLPLGAAFWALRRTHSWARGGT